MSATLNETSLQGWNADMVLHASRMLAGAIRSTDESKMDWVPAPDESSKARTIYDQAFECATVNRRASVRLKGETPNPPSEEPAPYKSKEEAAADVEGSARELAAVIRSCTPELLEQRIKTPFGEPKLANFMVIPAANMHYHTGVVNSYQLMYGDESFDFKPEYMPVP